MGFLFRKPKIQGDERDKCLAYLEEEFRISAFQEKKSQLFKDVMAECSLKGARGKEAQHRMGSAAKRLAKAAEQILRHRAKFTGIPNPALPTYSAWNRVYSAFSVWWTEQAKHPEVLVSDIPKDEVERIRKLIQEYEKCKAEAAKEHYKLVKRLKLSDEEHQELFKKGLTALSAVEAENWQTQKSEEI